MGVKKENIIYPFNGIIPKEFMLAGQKYSVNFNNDPTNGKVMGLSSVVDANIDIYKTYEGEAISPNTYENTYYHELVHQILDNMGEKDLSGNEKFVCSFAGFLTEVMNTAIGNLIQEKK